MQDERTPLLDERRLSENFSHGSKRMLALALDRAGWAAAAACRRWRLMAVGLLAFFFAAPGCDGGAGSGARMQGAVTIDGQEIPSDASAHIKFVPESTSNEETVTAPIVGSRYDCPNVALGPVTVYFEIIGAVGPMKRSPRTGSEYREIVNLVPPERAAGFQLEVTGDKADQDFDL